MVPILKRSSLPVDIETFGARSHICYGTSSRTFVVLSNHGTALVGEGISRYNSWFRATFLWIIFQDSARVNTVDRTPTGTVATTR